MFLPNKKKIEYLRNTWGKEIDKHRNYDFISYYYNLVKKNEGDEFVDEKTWNDLDLNLVYAKIDRNISGIGEQYLYYLIHKYENDEKKLNKRNQLILHLKENKELRENLQLNLFNLSGFESYFISFIVLSKNLPNTKFYPIFYFLSFLSIISITLTFYNGIFLFISMFILLTNLLLNRIFSKKIYEYFTGFASLNKLLISAISIGKIKTNKKIFEIEYLNQKSEFLKTLKKKLGNFVIDKSKLNEFSLVLIEYLNMFFLFDLIAYYRSVNILIKHQSEIHETFVNVANLDASISVASYLEEIPFYSTPTFIDTNKINIKELYHPLLKNAVTNSINEIDNSVLITGSNMSGKTTFIKTIGISFILSQTLYLSLSRENVIPKLIVKSSIHRNEKLEEGKSYFFVEIELIQKFIEISERKKKYLFLIDEIFRGTNTIERLAASTSVLSYLDKNNKVFVTTHDIELQDLLENNFRMFHFSEQVEDDKFFFDYKIQEGPCSSGNAIKLLGIMNYPEIIISESEDIVQYLLNNINKLNPIKT